MYKNNSGLNDKTKLSRFKKGLRLTEKLVRKNPLLFLYQTVVRHKKKLTFDKRKIHFEIKIKV